MLATRRLHEMKEDKEDGDDDQSERLIDALQYANEQLVDAVNASQGQSAKVEISNIYVDFVEEWLRVPTLEETLVRSPTLSSS